jgi:predicted dehydrogenase
MGTLHAEHLDDIGATIVGGADVMADARESFTDEFDVPTFGDHEELYDETAPDAVVITTPNAFHAPAAVEALERDVAVLVEKPLADTLQNAIRIKDAADASDAFCMVGFHNRFCAAADLFHELDREGRFGEFQHVEVNNIRRRGIPGIGSWFTTNELSGGGALIDIGVHALDFALYLLGYPDVTDVSGTTRAAFGNRENYADPDGWCSNRNQDGVTFDVDDSATAFIRCENGTTISLEVAWATNREGASDVTVRGTDAGATLSIGGDTLQINETGTRPHDHYSDTEYEGDRETRTYRAEDELFVRSVADGTAPETNTVEEALTVQRLLDAIYRSSETGSAVTL